MKIEIYGVGCPRCNDLEKNVINALAELDIAADVAKITDIKVMVSKGIMITPALFIDDKNIIEGKTPSAGEIKKILEAYKK